MPWDYLIVTAANELQAAAYGAQIRTRRELGQLSQVREALVVPDAGGCRIGSGGSTLQCLKEVLRREAALQHLRILIVHAGGDSRRLPAYSPCGKIFVPLPGDVPSALTPTLFDRLVPAFLDLPPGQIVVAAGDALILFDPSEVSFQRDGITALGVAVPPEEAARHGVLCPNPDGGVRLYLQKPSIPEQARAGAIRADGWSMLDIGVMHLDANAATCLLRAFATPAAQAAIQSHGIDLYREICCALGTDATFAHYLTAARSSGSHVDEPVLAALFDELHSIPLNLQPLRQCHFLHFGSSRQLISSGLELITRDRGAPPSHTTIEISSEVQPGGRIDGTDSWVEGCRLQAPLTLHGRNVVVGADIAEPFELPEGGCLDISSGLGRQGEPVCFVRYYGVDDTFKHSIAQHATFCGQPLADWLRVAGVPDVEIWSRYTPEAERTLWNARVFPAEKEPGAFVHWRWMLDISHATSEQKRSFLSADRYSSAEIAQRADQDAFHSRRAAIRACEIRRSPARFLAGDSPISARELAFALQNSAEIALMTADLLAFVREHADLELLSAAIDILCGEGDPPLDAIVPGLTANLSPATKAWVESRCGPLRPGQPAREWSARLRGAPAANC